MQKKSVISYYTTFCNLLTIFPDFSERVLFIKFFDFFSLLDLYKKRIFNLIIIKRIIFYFCSFSTNLTV